uniref:Uncharacterized protein n=1 Tax=Anguilla anguilla TaxID=7936 RepID=A0A0E9SVD3_ANGAN
MYFILLIQSSLLIRRSQDSRSVS